MRMLFFFAVLLFCSHSYALGRLFTTEAQRYQLEQRREQHEQIPPQPSDSAQTLVLNGFVKSRQGHKTLWINGALHDKFNADIKPLAVNADQVIIDTQGRRIRLKPGQTLDMKQHQIRDIFDQPSRATDTNKDPAVSSQSDQTQIVP